MIDKATLRSPRPPRYRFARLGIPLVLLLGPLGAQEIEPLDGEQQVNAYTTADQVTPAVAAADDGHFVVVWGGYAGDTDTAGSSIHGRRFDAQGAPIGGELEINDYTTGAQRFPDVAVEPDGDFVVVWASLGSAGTDSSSYSIQARRFGSDGTPSSESVQINQSTTNVQLFPSIDIDASGRFVVAWQSDASYGTDTDYTSIQARFLGVDGAPLSEEFQVNTLTSSSQINPDVAFGPDDGFVVVWFNSSGYSPGDDSDGRSIVGHRFNSNGLPLGNEFQVNSYTTYDQYSPSVSVARSGGFVVVWSGGGSDGDDTSYYSTNLQRFDSLGTTLGIETQVNTYTTNHQTQPTVDHSPNGDFLVAWSSGSTIDTGPDQSGTATAAQLFSASGELLGAELIVNSYTTDSQGQPAVAVDASGTFVIAWRSEGSYGSDNDEGSIQLQRYRTLPLFVDGFESGDTTAWSVTIP